MQNVFYWLIILLGVAMLAFVARHFAEGGGDTGRPSEDGVPGEDVPEEDGDPPPDLEREAREEESEAEPGMRREDEASPKPMIDNSAIRKRAWRLFRKNYLAIVPVVAVWMLFNQWISALHSEGWIGDWSALVKFLFDPILSVGLASAMLGFWRDGHVRIAGMVSCFSKPRRFLRMLGIMLIPSLAAALSMLGLTLYGGLSAFAQNWSGLYFFLIILLLLAAVWLMIWLNLRFALMAYVLVMDPEASLREGVSRGLRATRGRLGAILGMEIVTGFPLYALILILSFTELRTAAPVVRYTVTFLINTLYQGYPNLCMAGLAEAMLEESE